MAVKSDLHGSFDLSLMEIERCGKIKLELDGEREGTPGAMPTLKLHGVFIAGPLRAKLI